MAIPLTSPLPIGDTNSWSRGQNSRDLEIFPDYLWALWCAALASGHSLFFECVSPKFGNFGYAVFENAFQYLMCVWKASHYSERDWIIAVRPHSDIARKGRTQAISEPHRFSPTRYRLRGWRDEVCSLGPQELRLRTGCAWRRMGYTFNPDQNSLNPKLCI